jgi:putative inorganic carbon (HCO3(-)) transporter
MNPRARSTLVQHAIALDLVVLATGAALLFHTIPLAVLACFVAATAVSAWIGPEELGLFATGYSVIILGLVFGDVIDVTALTTYAIAGAAISGFFRAFRRVRADERGEELPAPAAAPITAPAALPFAIGLPLLVIAVYSDLSDTIMRMYHLQTSLLQPIIALITIAVWNHRRSFRPGDVALYPPPLLFGIYAIVTFTSSIWATEAARADGRLNEVLKAVFICILVASMSASWSRLRLGMGALVAAATFFSIISVIQILTGWTQPVLGGLLNIDTGNIYADVTMPRASGPPVNDPNFYARILLLAVPLAVALALSAKTNAKKISWFLTAAAISAGVLVTYSRGAMLALIAVLIMLMFAARVRVRTMVTGAVAFLLVLSILPVGIAQRRLSTLSSLLPGKKHETQRENSIEMRELFGRTALAMIAQHPITGVGAGHYSYHYFTYSNIAGSAAYDYAPAGTEKFAHSLWLEIGAETGLLGLIPFFGALAAALVMLWNIRRTLLARGDPEHAFVATSIAITIAGYIIASAVLHDSHIRYIALCFGFTCGIARLVRLEVAEA